jgi:hypothetical protein
MFEMDTKIWSETCINLPPDRAYYQFDVDNDAILSVVTYSKADKDDKNLTFSAALVRIPLKNPTN